MRMAMLLAQGDALCAIFDRREVINQSCFGVW